MASQISKMATGRHLEFEKRDHLWREHLTDFEREWSKLLISSETPLPLKMDTGFSDSSRSKYYGQLSNISYFGGRGNYD